MSVLCYMSLSFGCGRVCSCERAGCVLRTLYLYVVMFWFLCSQVVLAGGKYVCGGTLVVDVRVICYSRVRERTSHSGPSSYCWPRRGCMGGCIRYRDETCSRETILLAGESS